MTTPIHVFPGFCDTTLRRSSRNLSSHNVQNTFKNTKKQLITFGAWTFFAFGILFLSKHVFYGVSIGVAELVFCILLSISLLIWGLMSFCEALRYYLPNPRVAENGYIREPLRSPGNQNVSITITEDADVPPRYSMIATLSPNNNGEVLHSLESPPPSYDNVSPDK